MEQRKRYVILVGDVIKSGKIKDRKTYWDKFESTTYEINKIHKDRFYAPLVILKGDEISAVLKDFVSSYIIIRDFQEKFYPYMMRFAVVYGDIDVALETKNASLMDGPGFRKADEHLEKLKKEEKFVYFDLSNKTIDNLLSSVGNLVASLKYKWTEREHKIIHLYEKYKNQKKVAGILNISQQSVSSSLKRSNWKLIRDSEDNIIGTLRIYDSGGISWI